MHRTATMSANNNHVDVQIRGLLEDCFYRCTVHKKRGSVQACLAQSICNLLNLAMLVVESFREGFPGGQWIHFEFHEVWLRLRVMQNPYLRWIFLVYLFDFIHNNLCGFRKVYCHQ